jgi:hypothetical protein
MAISMPLADGTIEIRYGPRLTIDFIDFHELTLFLRRLRADGLLDYYANIDIS